MSSEEIVGADGAGAPGGEAREGQHPEEVFEEATQEANEEAHAPVEVRHAPVEVGLQRSVRYGRILISGAVIGALVGVISSLLFPVAEGANYELGQAMGVALVFGGAIGLGIGSLFSLFLGILARRKRGAAMAVQTDVR